MQSKNPNTSKIPVGRLPGGVGQRESQLGVPHQFACRLHFLKRRSANKDSVAWHEQPLRHEVCTNWSVDLNWVEKYQTCHQQPHHSYILPSCFHQCLWDIRSCDSICKATVQSYRAPANYRVKPLKSHVPFEARPRSLNVLTWSPGQSFGSTLQTTQCSIQCLIKVLHSGPWCKKSTNILWKSTIWKLL